MVLILPIEMVQVWREAVHVSKHALTKGSSVHVVGVDLHLTYLLIMQSMHLDLAERILVSWSQMQYSKFILCARINVYMNFINSNLVEGPHYVTG
jgi:hypothetical protein